MFEVTEENYHQFLSFHGLTVECAKSVISQYDNTDGYNNLLSVKLWVDASKMVLKLNGN